MPRIFWFALGTLLYVLFPRDLVPDFLPGWGWLDDLMVIYLLWRYYRRYKAMQRSDGQPGPSGETAGEGHQRSADDNRREPRDPYAVLGIAPGADRDEIKAAYRRMAAQYHPDKVQHLGREFQELAEKRFREIQQAYDELIAR